MEPSQNTMTLTCLQLVLAVAVLELLVSLLISGRRLRFVSFLSLLFLRRLPEASVERKPS